MEADLVGLLGAAVGLLLVKPVIINDCAFYEYP